MKTRKRRTNRARELRVGLTHPHAKHRPQTAEQFFALSQRSQDKWNGVVQAISKMRAEGVSLQQASREFGVNSRSVVRLGRSALRKQKNGRYVAKSSDRLLRVVLIPASDGLHEIAVRDSREASKLGEYWAGVQKYLETGDESALRRIRRKTITSSDGKRIRLIKDPAELERLGSAGVLSFESLYAKAA